MYMKKSSASSDCDHNLTFAFNSSTLHQFRSVLNLIWRWTMMKKKAIIYTALCVRNQYACGFCLFYFFFSIWENFRERKYTRQKKKLKSTKAVKQNEPEEDVGKKNLKSKQQFVFRATESKLRSSHFAQHFELKMLNWHFAKI